MGTTFNEEHVPRSGVHPMNCKVGAYRIEGTKTVPVYVQRFWQAASASSAVWPLLLRMPSGGIAKHVSDPAKTSAHVELTEATA